MNIRKLNDVEMITELTRRGYVVRRANQANVQIVVEVGDPAPAGWQQKAVEAIREKVGFEHILFEQFTSPADTEIHRAVLRIL